MLNEAKTSTPRPRPRPKIIMKKYQIGLMINNIRFKTIAGKFFKKSRLLHDFCPKMPDYVIRKRDRGQDEAKCLRPRPRPKPRPKLRT